MQTQTTEVDRPTLTVFLPRNHAADDEILSVVYDIDIIMGEKLDLQAGPHQTAYILELQDTLGSHHIKWLEAVGAVYRYDVPMEHLAVVEQVRCTHNIDLLRDIEMHFEGDVPAAVAEALNEKSYRLAIA